ncbi:ACB 4-hydroxyacetophenone monooxygenase [Fusarium phyllophilum]|uniref:ACB 4-hydroxyacetophenone monooxygenase n=1 Tax=Fusarium phyllophilum TaxID=47803 RepID=A0A8H5JZD0_9HYPO|nr:ACB 4-hydroxyacetophenone monooxygenase [Fusarium phyllophilum]
MTSTKELPSTCSQFACIGAGFSGIALGATLKRWYGITDVLFFERHSDLGGTWYANKYPAKLVGAACDVPSVLYSYSFEPNPNWSRVLPSQEELWKYQKHVADKYDLPSKMTFSVEVQKCQWIEERKRWVLDIRDCKTGAMFHHKCRFLFAASGILVTPREIDIPGSENFKGSIFHTSQWRSDVDVKDKNVVVIGNGCTAAQIVPSIVDKTKHLTQIVRAKHWMLPPIDGPYTDSMKSIFKYLPGTMKIQRLLIFLFAEIELKAVPMTTSAAKFRQKRRAYAEKFMRDTAPAKYHDLLIPDFEIGCKRRIYDSGYLACLQSKNLTLTNERALKIVENGVETDRGFVEADVIVLANGFSTNTFLEGVEVVGREETLTQHWESFGGAEAYNCSAMNGFPNFFMLLGPNATTGHTSAIMAIENSVNFALRILKPILGSPKGVVELDRIAEERYVNRIQDDLSKTVWNSGCQSWYIQPHSENSRVWNAMVYPYSQGYLWYRSLFPVWRDWKITGRTSNWNIRLLRLLPHQDEHEPIQCQLFNCALGNSGSTRPYEALSYVWGSDHGSQSISIDRCYLHVGRNLFDALLHLRDPSIERILWIDAVCINQEDKTEKGHQVQSMAKIYAKATRVIVWLGKATSDIDQAFDLIRIAGFTAKQPTITTRNKYAILRVLMAPWFRRIWVLQEVAAARHILVQCGHAEIDGYAFFAGLGVFELPHEDYAGLRLLVLSVAYLAKGAAFRSRCATRQAGRFSLNICPLAQLVDMFHGRLASDRRDKIYALLGMCSDDPSISGLLVNYDIACATVFQRLVSFILGSASSVETWDNAEVAVIRIKGCVIGQVSSFYSDIDREGEQHVGIDWQRKPPSPKREKFSYLKIRPSAVAVKARDTVCLLQGATLPTIIRICKDYWKIITIAAPLPEDSKDVDSDDDSSLPAIRMVPAIRKVPVMRSLPAITSFPHDFLLVWDWNIGQDESQGAHKYDDLISKLASTAPESGLQSDLDRITRYWHSGVVMRSLNNQPADENLGYALMILEGVLGGMTNKALTELGQACGTKRGDIVNLQGTVGLLLEGESGHIPLCMAAGDGHVAVVRLLLGTGKVDPDARDFDGQSPLWRAAKNGHTTIVKLLLDTCNVDPDAGHDEFVNDNRTPLSLAAENGHEAIVKLLIDTGKVDLNAWDLGRHHTPLIFAAQNGYLEIVKLLLNTGKVSLDPRPNNYVRFSSRPETALSLAVKGGHKEIFELLRNAWKSESLLL